MEKTMGINDWAEQERPRERLVREGAQALSNSELLALLLRVGVPGKSAVELGRDVLQHFGSLHGLFGATLADFSEVHGLGMAKYAQMQAVMELARRAIAEQMQAGDVLSSPEAVKRYLRIRLGGRAYESFVVLFVDVKNRQRPPARSGQGSAGLQCGQRPARAQPPVRLARPERSRCAPDPHLDSGPGPGRDPRTRPFRGGRPTCAFFCRARPAIAPFSARLCKPP
jgi:DNA repair protein RadC